MDTKLCNGKCGRILPASDEFFYRTGRERKYLASVCKKCYASGTDTRKKRLAENRLTAKDKLYYEIRKSNWKSMNHNAGRLSKIKLDSGCVDCGFKEHAAALDFDHLPGCIKLFSISFTMAAKFNQRTWDEIDSEIKKCEVVCANCHRIRTWKRRSQKAA
jgi:hypothetical protein